MRFYISYTWWDKESDKINKWLFDFIKNNPIEKLFVYGTEINNFEIQFHNGNFEILFSIKKAKNYPYLTHLISDGILYDNGVLRVLSQSGKEDFLTASLTPINEFIAGDTINNETHLYGYFSETHKKRSTNPFLDSWDRLVNAEL